MAVTGLTYIPNVSGATTGDTFDVHSICNVIVDAEYTGSTKPFGLNLKIYDENDVLLYDTYPVVKDDIDSTTRRFAFIGQSLFKTLMDSFDDTFSEERVLEHLPNMTTNIKLLFSIDSIELPIFVTLKHAASQFNENVKLTEYFNQELIYTGEQGDITESPVYIYFYNDDINNIITFNTPEQDITEYALDWDQTVFTDNDGYYFRIVVKE